MMCLVQVFFAKQLIIEMKDTLWSSSIFVSLMKLEPFAFIIITTSFCDHLFYYKNTLPTPTPNAEFTRRLYSVHAARPQRANGALEDPTALPQRAV